MREIERPPLGVLLRYRLYGSRVPDRYVAWAERDIRSPWWPWLSSAPMPLVITFGIAAFSDVAVVWWLAALVGGFVLSLAIQGARPGRAYARQRALALRYQRGEVTRDEWRRLQHGEFSWSILALALGVAAVAFIVLYVLDRL